MQKNKVYFFILFLIIGLSSCGEYQKVLNKGSAQDQYKLATSLYEQQKYNKAIPLFEKLTSFYRGKPQMERIQFMIAQSHYNTKQHSLASYYFDKFVANYPKSSKVEEAAYLAANSYYQSSPRFSLDQKDTDDAIDALQSFIFKYPNSDNVVKANLQIKELTDKLEKKSFEIARQYYHTEDYIAAISAFDNLISEYLGTTFKEEALYLKFKSSYELGMKSYIVKKEIRINDAIKVNERLKRNFPESIYLAETNKMEKSLIKELSFLSIE